MPAVANLVHQTTTETGAGDLTLDSVSGKQTFAQAFATGGSNTFDYFISNQSAAEWERGTGSISVSGVLTRDTVLESSNSDAAVTFTAGTKDVTNDVPATLQVQTTLTQTLTNKTLTSPTINSPALSADSVDAITEIASALKSGADSTLITGTAGTSGDLSQWNADGDLVDGPTPPTGTIVGTTDTQTLTNKTLTSPVINTSVSGTAVLDEDNMASDSATQVATQQSIKAYVDTTVAAQVDFTDSTFRVSDNTDATKKIAFESSGITTATVRTFTAPDKSGTIALAEDIASTSNGLGASLVGIEDSGALITATDVEGALAENRAAIDAIEATGADVTKVGTPASGEMAVWTGDGTLGEANDISANLNVDVTAEGIEVYEAANDANPQFRLGATDAEELHIQTVYDSAAQTLDYVLFQTDTASATADKGKFVFNVDGTESLRIVDGGFEVIHSTPYFSLTDTTTGAVHNIDANSSSGNFYWDIDFTSQTSDPSLIIGVKGNNLHNFSGSSYAPDGSTDIIALGDATHRFAGLYLRSDITCYEAANDANPEFRLGSADAEELHIQAVYDSGAQTLDYVIFQTDVASATADKGLFRFNVDGTDILDIDDGGISMASGKAIYAYDATNAQVGTTYTLALTDTGQTVTMSNASANTLTIPTNASVAFPVGTRITVIQLGAGATSISGDTGVTLNGVSAGSGTVSAQYDDVRLLKIASDTWVASGDIGAVA